MKNIATAFFILAFFTTSHAQTVKPALSPHSDFHLRKGFHFEFGLGPAFGTITDKGTQSGNLYNMEFSGAGFGIDLKLGGYVQDNLALTFDILSKAISSPTVVINGTTVPTSNDYSISEVTYGAGFTYYLMPSDVLLSATLGAGTFVSQNSYHITSRTDYGFSLQLKVGKHWWISEKWGIAVSGAYGTTSASDAGQDIYGTFTDDISSSRFTIMASIGYR